MLKTLFSFLTQAFISQFGDRASFIKNYSNNAFAGIMAGFAFISFIIYHEFTDREIVRKSFLDIEYGLTMQLYSSITQSPKNAPNIITILIDEEYLKNNNLSDSYGGLRFNFTPRSVLANILNSVDSAAGDVKPKMILLDYVLLHSSDINSTAPTQDDMSLINSLNRIAKHTQIMIPTLKDKLFIEDLDLHKNIKFISTMISRNKDGVVRGFL